MKKKTRTRPRPSKAPSFPSSRELFELVRDLADSNGKGAKMSDVDIGRLVGFESARTSRWKHGQISVADAARLNALGRSLDIDISVLTQVACGELTAAEALRILKDSGKFVRFLTDQIVLPMDDQLLTIGDGEGTRAQIVRHRPGVYRRAAKRVPTDQAIPDTPAPLILLADSDESTRNVFKSLTDPDAGIRGALARTGPEALLLAGELAPEIIVFDLFIGGVDGMAAIKTLKERTSNSGTEIFATSLVTDADTVRSARGCGARQVIPRPLRAHEIGQLVSRARRRA
jgi:CheY-like chemotaxis protein